MAREETDLLMDDELAAFIDSSDDVLATNYDGVSEEVTSDSPSELNQEWADDSEVAPITVDDLPTDNLAVDCYETKDHLVVMARTAGISGKDLDVNVDEDNILTISGILRGTNDTDIVNWHLEECYWGKFSRSIALPIVVKKDGVEASIKNGFLTITFEKEQPKKPERITVNDL